tara:strand:+ start:352 stop:906 length:555 start_codon:yes stop_codon:yes gene_type:complete
MPEQNNGPKGVVPPAERIAASAIARLNTETPIIWLVSGPSSKKRGDLTNKIAKYFQKSAIIDGESISKYVLEGRVLPGEEPDTESERQIELSIRNQCLLARSFSEAGFVSVINYAILTSYHLDAYRHYLSGGELHLAVIPTNELKFLELNSLLKKELHGIGYWVEEIRTDASITKLIESKKSIL